MSLPQDAALDFLLERSRTLLDTHSRIWNETPVGFEEFVVKHMKGEITERQLKDASMIFGNDPERSFTGGAPYHMLCLLAGKGSGKDTLASYMIVYCFYLCLCMRNPQEFFGFTVMDAIDMLIISYTEEQARDVNFNKIKQLFLHWNWLWDNYTVLEGDKILNQPGKPTVTILADKIRSHNNVRIAAEHSKNESFEGYNVLFWIMSEACLRGRSRIKLADDRDMSIAEIVNKRLSVKVLTKNFQTGSLESKRVTNWFKYPRRSNLLQIRTGHSGSQNTSRQTVQCTPNHHVFTERGYIRADEVLVGDRMWTHGSFLSTWQREFLLGSLLGDASLHHHSATIAQFTHGPKQVRYLREISRGFGSMVTSSGIRWCKSGYTGDLKGTGQLMISSLSIPEITNMCKKGGRKTVTPEWAGQLTTRSLAAWFMDDGSSDWPGRYQRENKSKRGSYGVWLWCLDFSTHEARILLRRLGEMGYCGKIRFRRSTAARPLKRSQPYIRLNTVSSERFLREVSSFMFPSMSYKTPFPVPPPPTDDSQDHGLLCVKEITSIESESKKWKKSFDGNSVPNRGMCEDDEWVYDIEVEKNHNYFAGNVLVSNSAFEGRNKNSVTRSDDGSSQKSMTIGNGWKVFNTLRSSSSSRFSAVPGWKGFVCSYPRYDQSTDFTYQLYESAKKDKDIYADLCVPWEFKPARYYPSGKTFDFDGVMVPLEHQGDAMADPASFRKMYLCQVPDTGEKAIPIDVFAAAMHNFPQILIIDNEVRMNMDLNQECVVAILRGLEEIGRFQHEYLLTVDLGEKYAATGLALQHYDPDRGYILDAVGAWTPIVATRKGGPSYPVDMDDVSAKLVMLGKVIPNVKIGYDQWNKLLLQTVLSKNSIKTVEYHVYDRDYDVFRKALSGRQAWLVDDPGHELIRQMNAMVRVGKEIVLDQRISMRKDMLDCVVGGFKTLMDKPRAPMGIPGAFYIESNLDQFGGSFVPMAPRSPWTVQ